MAKQPNNLNPKNIPQGKKPKSSRVLYIIYGVIMMVLLFTMFNGGSAKRSIDWSRLEAILERIDNSEMEIDELAENVQEATGLLKKCRQILLDTEKSVQGALESLDGEADA